MSSLPLFHARCLFRCLPAISPLSSSPKKSIFDCNQHLCIFVCLCSCGERGCVHNPHTQHTQTRTCRLDMICVHMHVCSYARRRVCAVMCVMCVCARARLIRLRLYVGGACVRMRLYVCAKCTYPASPPGSPPGGGEGREGGRGGESSHQHTHPEEGHSCLLHAVRAKKNRP